MSFADFSEWERRTSGENHVLFGCVNWKIKSVVCLIIMSYTLCKLGGISGTPQLGIVLEDQQSSLDEGLGMLIVLKDIILSNVLK